ncbi:hypothetical protein, partial [Streptomyces yangpuensis]|uniref:hypothetical protein n=1 Tax=Streptomyces yangpuensis TaxID=1648182 RepID=UPI00365498A0
MDDEGGSNPVGRARPTPGGRPPPAGRAPPPRAEAPRSDAGATPCTYTVQAYTTFTTGEVVDAEAFARGWA